MRLVDMGDTPFGFLQACDGIQLRYGFWPRIGDAHQGTVLVLGGRTEFMEKYSETIGEINQRGFDAFSIDWRGQGLSDRMLADPTRGHIQSFSNYLADLELFINKIVRPNHRGPLVCMAHSMGANIALHYLHKFPFGLDQGVLLSPMINIRTDPVPHAMAKWYCRIQVKLGMADRILPSLRRNDSFRGSFDNNWLTHDSTRFFHVQRLLQENPQLVVMGATYGWLAASFAAMETLGAPGFAQHIVTPLLVVTAGNDRVVSNEAVRRFAAQLPAHETICVQGAYHEILQERDDLRDQFWHAFDRFIQR
jgi:lysophospholipase